MPPVMSRKAMQGEPRSSRWQIAQGVALIRAGIVQGVIQSIRGVARPRGWLCALLCAKPQVPAVLVPAHAPDAAPAFYSVRQAAVRAGRTPGAIYGLLQRNAFPSEKKNGQRRIPAKEFDAWLSSQKGGTLEG
jgi:hypothetical protein